MTTQHTHHEHSDADASVVEHASVPETSVDPSASATVTSEEETDTTVSSLLTPAQVSEEAQEETHTPQAEVQIAPPQEEKQQKEEQQAQEESTDPTAIVADKVEPVAETGAEPIAEPVEEPVIEAVVETVAEPTIRPVEESGEEPAAGKVVEEEAPAYTPTIALTENEEEIRPFTAFIEEFRQAEARLNASVQESEVEAFASSTEEETPEAKGKLSDTASFIAQLAETIKKEARADEKFAQKEDATEKKLEATATQEEVKEVKEESSPTPPVVERAVSPLLRPPSRLRIPRHGGRQHREEVAETVAQPPTETPSTVATPRTPVETPAETEKPRPARRYRFDRRPAADAAITPAPPAPSLPRAEEKPVARQETVQQSNEQNNETPARVISPVNGDQQAVRQNNLQELLATEPVTPPEHSRRRGHERTKEQPTILPPPLPPIEVTAPVPEPTLALEDIAPEDLPPLEYSELQKASSRRRRRHRTTVGSNGAASTPIAPVVLPVAPVQPAATARPATPTSPLATPPALNAPAANAAYTIVSGYTVNQMNQGNEMSGPFMGPEPSPARGSVLSRDGRTTRAETQRAPAYPSTPTPREGGLSSSALNHFANVVSQAIQTQTDRMVAELRRNSQAPTNVSVSLPPFPSTERVGVFVDVANLLYSARTLRITVDFGKLLDFLRGNRRLVRAHAYCPTSPQPGDEQMFLQAVKGLGYRITTKNYKTFSSGAKKADLDLDLCMDVVRLVDGRSVDCIVLVSGDSDFMPMLDYCSDHGVRVEVAAFDEAMSATLRQSCDLFVNLSMLEEIRS